MFFLLILVLQFTVRQQILSVMVRGGRDVTLPCRERNNHSCVHATWLFTRSPKLPTEELFPSGPTGAKARAKSNRLSVTKNCSLVIKTVTVEDAGRYICKQHQQEKRRDLSVLTVTEHKGDKKVTLNCSVSTYGQCGHEVKWLYGGKEVDDDNADLKTTESTCSGGLTFETSHFVHTLKKYDLLKCDVTDIYTKEVKQLNFSPESSSEKPDGENKAAPGDNDTTTPGGWWRLIIVSAGLPALIISVVTVNIRTRTKGNKTQTDGNTERNDEDDDEGTVVYENTGEPSVSIRQ